MSSGRDEILLLFNFLFIFFFFVRVILYNYLICIYIKKYSYIS